MNFINKIFVNKLNPQNITHEPTNTTLQNFYTIILQASKDPAFYNNSIPNATNTTQIQEWLTTTKTTWNIWVITLAPHNTPIGYLSLHHPPQLTENPEPYLHHHETDSYLLPPYRGQKIMTHAWTLLYPQLDPNTKLVAEVWSNNTASTKRLQRDG
jgi:RimJ/RimL family protein N-acetyltransferase